MDSIYHWVKPTYSNNKPRKKNSHITMLLENNKLFHLCCIILFLLACKKDPLTSVSNQVSDSELPDLVQLDLQSNSGDNLNSVTIIWNRIDGNVTINDEFFSLRKLQQ